MQFLYTAFSLTTGYMNLEKNSSWIMKTIKKKKHYVHVGFDPPTFYLRLPNATRYTTRYVLSQQVEKSYFYRRVHIKGAERYYWGRGGGGGHVAITWHLLP